MALVIAVSRSALSLPSLVMSGEDGGTSALAVSGFTEPGRRARVTWAPDSIYQDGSIALASSMQQSILGWDVFVDHAASEAASATLVAELADAVTGQLSFTVEVTIGGHAQAWRCQPGELVSAARTLADIRDRNPQWSVVVPCDPSPL